MRWRLCKIICLYSFVFLFGNIHFMATNTQQEKQNEPPAYVDDSQLNETTEAGTYPIDLIYEDENGVQTKRTIYVTIAHRRTQENNDAAEAIDAYDLELNIGEFSKLSDTELIQLAKAKAWNTKNGQAILIPIVERQIIDKNAGIYEASFKTAKGTATTIHITELENMYMQIGDKYLNYEMNYVVTVFSIISLILVIFLLIIFYLNIKSTVKEVDEVTNLLQDKIEEQE